MFGYRREELIGQNIRMLVPELGAASSRASSKSLAVQAACELSARARMASNFPVEISLSPLQTEEGLLVTSAIRDVTERKKSRSGDSRAERHAWSSAWPSAPQELLRIQRSPAAIQRRSEPVRLRRQSRSAGAAAHGRAVQPDAAAKIRGHSWMASRSVHLLRRRRRAAHGDAAEGSAGVLARPDRRRRVRRARWTSST